MRVILFDIDGTLIRSGGAGKAAMEQAVPLAFGVDTVDHSVPFAGRTDPAIVRDLLGIHGIEPTPENARRLTDAYLELLPQTLAQLGGIILPDVIHWLDHFAADPHSSIGLVTGNNRRGAEIKLRFFGLWHYFPYGGFADNAFERADVARQALVAAREYIKIQAFSELWVVGDTPADVACAKVIEAKALGVGTGWHDLNELHESGADCVVRDLTHLASWGVAKS